MRRVRCLGSGASATNYVITALSIQGNYVKITWTTVGGKTNIIQAAYVLSNYFDLATNIAAGSGQVTTNYTHVNGATNSPAFFYRIRVLP